MKKTLIVLCCTALLLVGLFCFGFVVPTTASPARPTISYWDNPRVAEVKMLAAKEMDSADAIKMLPGIVNANVNVHRHSEWSRNVWTRRHATSVGVFVEASDNRPLDISVINAIGLIIGATFGIDEEEIRIVDTKHHREYNGAGEALPRETATVPPLPVVNTAIPSPGTTATPSSPAPLNVDQDYIALLKKRVEVAQAELALLEAEFALRQ